MVRASKETVSDDAVRAATGHGREHWFRLLDGAGASSWNHTAIARHLTESGLDAWWAQGVTVAYEQARGLRLPGQQPDGTQLLADLELVRMAMPRRVFTRSQVDYVVDRLHWLWDNRDLVGGLEFVEEPTILRFFYGRLEPIGDWQVKLAEKFGQDFPGSL